MLRVMSRVGLHRMTRVGAKNCGRDKTRGAASFRFATPQAWRTTTRHTDTVTRLYESLTTKSRPGCGWGDSNSHGLAPRTVSVCCVYQFRHTRTAFRQSAATDVPRHDSGNARCRWPGEHCV